MADPRITRRGLIGGAAAGTAAGAIGGLPSAQARARRPARRARQADVVVVGAGLAGLAAARELVKAGRSVLVLEARKRVGGRTLNHPIGGGKISEVGGQYVGPTQDRVLALAKDVGVDTFPTYDTGDNVYLWSGRRLTWSDTGLTGSAPPDPLFLADIASVVAQIDQMAAQVPLDAPWTAPQAAVWDGQTVETFFREHSLVPGFRDLADLAVRAIFGVEPREMSVLFALAYTAGAGNEHNAGTFERLFNTRAGAQERRFVGGSQVISLRVAAALGRRVLLGQAARRIAQSRKAVRVESDGLVVRAKHVIVAIPPTLAGRILYSPQLPALRDQLTQRLYMGTLIKAEAVYDRPFWRDQGLNGSAVTNAGPSQVIFDNTPPEGTPGVMFGFLGGDKARAWAALGAAERRAKVLATFADCFGPTALAPRDYFEMNWATEAWTRGCPVAVAPPGTLTEYGPALRAPVGRIHWAGTETATYWNGYMDGAVRSGERAAKEVLAQL